MFIYKAGVVGAGTMGAQIAQVISFSGLPVVLADVNDAIARRGIETVRRIYQARVDKGKLTPEQLEEKMLLVTPAGDLEALGDVDLVVEAVSEEMGLKQQVFRDLDRVCAPGSLLASNTSALSISAIATATSRPSKVLGLHFFNPAYAMPLVEVIPGLLTDRETVDDMVRFAESLRKVPIVVKDGAGFLVNRVLMAYLNEAVWCVQEGVATVQAIDQEMTAFGMPTGPFTLIDQLGLDLSAEVARILHQSYGPRMTPAPLLEALVRVGRLGLKSGRGFYTYGEAGEGPAREHADRELAQLASTFQGERPTRPAGWNRNRLLFALVNEAVLCLQEGVATAGDIDLGMMAGTGFPKELEGPLHYADRLGLDQVLQQLQEFADSLGPRFWPAPLLRRMVEGGLSGVKAGRGFFPYGN